MASLTHNAGMRIIPLVRREAGHHEQGEAHQDVRSQHITEIIVLISAVGMDPGDSSDKDSKYFFCTFYYEHKSIFSAHF